MSRQYEQAKLQRERLERKRKEAEEEKRKVITLPLLGEYPQPRITERRGGDVPVLQASHEPDQEEDCNSCGRWPVQWAQVHGSCGEGSPPE